MLRLTLRNLAAHKRRLIGTSLAVCLGVAFLAGTFMLSDTMSANFDRLFTSSVATTDAIVRNADRIDGDLETAGALLPPSTVERIAGVDGVAATAPVIQGFGQLDGRDGEKIGGFGPPTFAASWIDDADLNPWRLAEGRAPRADDEVVINRGAAEDGDLHVGDTTTVETPAPVEVHIVGIATFGDEDGLGPTTYTAFTLAGAREHVLGGAPGVSEVRVAAAPGVSADELADRLSAALGDRAEVTTGAEFVDESNAAIDADFLGFVKAFLGIFGGIALLVAAFSIHNTFAIIVSQRLRESALLRAVGASERQVLGSIVLETLAIGIVAATLGVAVGIGFTVALRAIFDAVGFSLPAGGLTLTASSLVVAPLIGVLVTLVAGIGPALKAARVAPLAAMRDLAVERTTASRARVAAGLVVSGIGAAMVVTAALAGSDALPRAGFGALLTVVGVVVLGPVVAGPVGRVLGVPIARFRGLPGRLARRNAVRHPRRTAATASALLVGVGVVTLFTVYAASLKASVDDSISAAFTGDLVIPSSGVGGGGLSPELADRVAQLPEVDTAAGLGAGEVRVDGGGITPVVVADPVALDGVLDRNEVDGSMADLGPDEVGVSRLSADDHGWARGDELSIHLPDGTDRTFTIGVLYGAQDALGGDLLVPAATWADHTVQQIDSTVLVALADGVSVAEGETAVQQVADRFGSPEVMDLPEFLDYFGGRVDAILGLVYVMLALAIVIALMGIANALSLATHERTRELGLLRAVGATRGQVRSMVRWEAVLVALLGAAVGVGLGLFLGWALVTTAADIGIETFAVPVGQLAVVLVVGALAGSLAAIRPARRAARLDVLEALATT